MAETDALQDDPLWYKDAIVYELHVKAYRDTNGDGVGDFQGLIEKLDYLFNLGVTAVWLLPFYPSPLKDDGYDIADYTGIHPAYGTLADFRQLLREAHERGIRVITELVLNHTSDQHPWFRRARQARPGSSARNFYVWSDTPDRYADTRIIFRDFERSNWTYDAAAKAYFWHRFYSHQPDLNFDSPRVQRAVMRALDFWLELGVDGLRLDAVPYLYEREGTNCENLPETHAFLRKLRAHVDGRFRNRMLLAEANQWSEETLAYFGRGDECHMAFNFPVMPRMFMALQMEDRFPITNIFDPPLTIPENCQWALFLRNHDELTLEMVTDEERDYMYRYYAASPRARINLGIRRRLAPLLSNDRRRIELMNFLLFSLPGTPVIYYGDEIGMGDNYHLGDRDGVRTPMQWSPDRNAGFSRVNPQELYLPVIIDPEYHYEVINVENQQRNTSSLLWWMQRVIAARKRLPALSRGSIRFLTPQNPAVLAFVREYQDETILVVVNLSKFVQAVELNLSAYAGRVPEEVFSLNPFPVIRETPYLFTLTRYSHFWLRLPKPVAAAVLKEKREYPMLHVSTRVTEALEGPGLSRFEHDVLLDYLPRCRWFGGKARRILRISVIETIPVIEEEYFLLLVDVFFVEGEPARYLVPLMAAVGPAAETLRQEHPEAIIATLRIGEREGFLGDALHDARLRQFLFDMVASQRRLRHGGGGLVGIRSKSFQRVLGERRPPFGSRLAGAEQTNSSVFYDDTLVLKVIRKLELGPHPEVEMVRALSERAGFAHVPAFAGLVEHRHEGSDPVVLGVMQAFIPNQGDAWAFALRNVGNYFDRLLSSKEEAQGLAPLLDAPAPPEQNDALDDFVGEFFLEMIALLARRTGEMHRALASINDDPDFAPEPFSLLYQRSIYQSMRGLVRRNFQTLADSLLRLPGEIRDEAASVLRLEEEILRRQGQVLERKISALKIRIHGDYHLGQVLFTGKDFYITDFEGEPARPLGERRLKRSPLRDVAGMLRSFQYAVHAGVAKQPTIRPEDMPFLRPWFRLWFQYVSARFLRAYLDTTQGAPFIPPNSRDCDVLMDAFLLSKAAYEIGYELNNRPDWVGIPLSGIRYIMERPPGK